MNRTEMVRHSALIRPINQPHFVEKVHLRGADAMARDLADSVPSAEKRQARSTGEGPEFLYSKLRMIIVADVAKEARKAEFLRLAGVP